MSLFAKKLKELVERIETEPDEFSKLVTKHNLENYSGPQDVLFSNIFRQVQKVILLPQYGIKPISFGIVLSDNDICVEVNNAYDELECELDVAA